MTKTQAVAHFGSQAALARSLGITRGSVHNWDEIPIGRQFQIEVLTGGELVADRDEQPHPLRRHDDVPPAKPHERAA